jgi:hypothetical protein
MTGEKGEKLQEVKARMSEDKSFRLALLLFYYSCKHIFVYMNK